jgi:hypothetical protein
MVYLALASILYLSWQARGFYSIVGDEPHYLIIADGLARDHTLEQTQAYRREFLERHIAPWGLGPEHDSVPSPANPNSHVAAGPHGLYNVHNIGLPLLLLVPFSIFGVSGAKLFMVLVSVLAVVVAWRIAGRLFDDGRSRWQAACATCVGAPLIAAASQLYPDVPAGIACLAGLHLLDRARGGDSRSKAWIACAAALAFLPWLHIRFAAPCLILAAALALRWSRDPATRARAIALAVALAMSFALLAAYNLYAFGHTTGPYQAGALELSRTSLMVLAGLFLDQNQGFLMQNPLMLVGLAGIVPLFARDRLLGAAWLLVFLSLIVPNGLHPNWYGGRSFSGRFGWAAEIVFILPTLVALALVAHRSRRAFGALVALGFIAQAYFFYKLIAPKIDLYNHLPGTPLDAYSIFYFPVRGLMPALYDAGWAFTYWPNALWLAVAVGLVLAGLGLRRDARAQALTQRGVSAAVA